MKKVHVIMGNDVLHSKAFHTAYRADKECERLRNLDIAEGRVRMRQTPEGKMEKTSAIYWRYYELELL